MVLHYITVIAVAVLLVCYTLLSCCHLLVGIIAAYSLPMTTVSSIETADGLKTTIEQLHNEFSQDVRPPCKVLCYAVSAGYSRVKNSETSMGLHIYIVLTDLFGPLKCWVRTAVAVAVMSVLIYY